MVAPIETGAGLSGGDEAVSILVVDDLPEKHLVFQSILDDLGAEIVVARSGKEALSQVLHREFAVILLDVNMPDIDGFETAALLRQYKKTAQTPIVFVTAYVDEIQAIRGYALGAVDYIPSPVVPEILRSKVKVFVDLHRANRQIRSQAAEREALVRAEAARAAAEAATRRADLLADASQALSRSLDPALIASGFLGAIVPALADDAFVVLGTVPHQWRLFHAKGDQTEAALPPVFARDIEAAIATGRFRQIQAASALNDIVSSKDGMTRAAVVPLMAGDRGQGALVLALTQSRVWTPDWVALAKDLAARAAIAFENAQLYSTIQDADRRKNEFLAMLAHELRNPLAPIRNAVHIIRSVGIEEPTVTWARDVIGRQVDHMARMVDDLLDVSRIAQGKVTVQRESFALATVFERAIEASRPHAKAKDQTLTSDLPPPSVVVHGDLVRLSQVLSNLLNNASKYTPENGHIDLSYHVEGGVVRITVADDGEGIEPDFLPRIFELFAQGDQTLDRSQGGLGIGLTLVKHLVELHGGRIEAASGGRNLGSTFTVWLPVQCDAVIPTTLPSPVIEKLGRPANILVVEDLPASAESLMLLLQLEGHEVRTANEGESALAIFERMMPDVVILDIGLPGMSGFEVARRMRQFAGIKPLIIALTGYGQQEDRAKGSASGIDHHLVKPANVATLLQLIAGRDDSAVAEPAVASRLRAIHAASG